ncbi:CRISPR-associated protein Cse1 [Haematobacter massiliensis]|uniref:CRISPR-associated protein Cse1 n=1 Tax=Haematobacter massiliensis TaxID=195105 RepID=A0A086Y239_9RHOB|nr:type I-E CRISPR-associated protein Cse1/CasA [Haematobacter massiliensis]KFI28339.1 CRISPR-associated protein Cse1 [Haematobacter massiliensis]OWJ84724.1 type I-E CRISPR-associated protein Cse1/CasA [Haematobacter massiliensis]QBJ26311.1 type I-E CRISPR-associated protein Cse1/CasA [Haematobacter massiliensis]
MPLNLISDPWIPVIDMSGARRIIAPWQMADAMILRPDWPRADLNIACIELLIGLVALADPPAHAEDWEDRQTPDPARLRERLAPFAPAFDLLGEGPRFMQELGGLIGDARAADLLFVDSGGEGGTLMVREGRYPGLDLPTAAMALYTMQTQAPSGGRGNLTSLRGGGPMTVLVDPGGGLWPLVWANVPDGTPARPEDLPWMRRTVTSEGGVAHFPHQGHPATVFFGMPRRLWLVAEEDRVTGVIQRPNGTRYTGWTHPLTPYYRQKAGDDPLPVRPRAGVFGYRHWLGVAVRSMDGLRELPATVKTWENERSGGRSARLIVAGWAMDNMKAVDYLHARPPLVHLEGEGERRLNGMVAAAEYLAVALRGALAPVLAEGEAREAVREEFYIRTQTAFEARMAELPTDPADGVARRWLADMRRQGMALFEHLALRDIADRVVTEQKAIVDAQRSLALAFRGYTPLGQKAFRELELQPPEKKKKEAA